MNPRARRVALHAIAAIAILASLNALAHSYAGLYQWAAHHHLAGWQALTWPAEIDVFLIIAELALYVAYLDGWSTRHKLWPWATALVGLAVSVAGNIGHIPASTVHPVPMVDRLTAATSPVAAFAGLAIALLVLKQTRHHASKRGFRASALHSQIVARTLRTTAPVADWRATVIPSLANQPGAASPATSSLSNDSPGNALGILGDAQALRAEYERRGARLSRRQLAKHLRARGHTLSNDRLPEIAQSVDL